MKKRQCYKIISTEKTGNWGKKLERQQEEREEEEQEEEEEEEDFFSSPSSSFSSPLPRQHRT